GDGLSPVERGGTPSLHYHLLPRRLVIRTYNLCLLGFGNVNQALIRLLRKKEPELRSRGIAWRITGVATRRTGWIADANGVEVEALLSDGFFAQSRARVPTPDGQFPRDVRSWLRLAKAD